MAICAACGEWTEPPILDPVGFDASGVVMMCPSCGHREPLIRSPLWWIAGSAGAGKSTLTPVLRRHLPDHVVFEGEAIDFWRFEGEPSDYSSLYNQWLKVAHEITLNDYPVVFIATALPDQLDACTFRSRFSVIHYLGLVCPEEVQKGRLQTRPAWRTRSPAFIRQSCSFTRRLEELAETGTVPIALHDTTGNTPEHSAKCIAEWVGASTSPGE